MKAEWKTFLTGIGAELDDRDQVVSYGSPKREAAMALSGNTFCDLSHFSLIEVRGKDAEDFLQNQLSNDVRQLTEERSQLTSYNSPKGRVLAIFRLFKQNDVFFLSLPTSLTESILKRLRMFVLRSDVTLEDISESRIHLGASGENIDTELERHIGNAPRATDSVLQCENYLLLRIPGLQPRYEIYAPLEDMKKLWEKLNVQCAPIGASAWGLLNVTAGLPMIFPETQEAFVAQMLNLQAVGGVSFKKGCYPGQEVVARMQYLGKLKRRMFIAQVDSEEIPLPGDEVFAESDSKQSAGKVVEAYAHPDGGCLLTAVIQIQAAEQEKLFLHSVQGPELHLQSLPYPLQQEE